jgi:hypothetical protein
MGCRGDQVKNVSNHFDEEANLSKDLYIRLNLGVIIVMRDFYPHGDRGRSQADRIACCSIEVAEGAVLEITQRHGSVEFVVGYCRKAIADRWGLCCFDSFKRVSDQGLTRSWAEPCPDGLLFFRAAHLRLTREEEWMLRRN